MDVTRNAIQAADDLKRASVDTPEWGGMTWVTEMTAGDKVAFVEWLSDDKEKPKNFLVELGMRTICDSRGVLLLAEADRPMLAKKSAEVLGRVCGKAMELNGLNKAAAEDAEKNFESTPAAAVT